MLIVITMMIMVIPKTVSGQRWLARPTTCLNMIASLSGPVKDEEGAFKVDIENEPKFYVPFERYTGTTFKNYTKSCPTFRSFKSNPLPLFPCPISK
jgi:hypothetical protein